MTVDPVSMRRRRADESRTGALRWLQFAGGVAGVAIVVGWQWFWIGAAVRRRLSQD